MRTTHISFAPNLTARAVVVSYDHNYGEYRARLTNAPEADYFTDDPTDALATAIAMAKHAHPGKPIHFYVTKPRRQLMAALAQLQLADPALTRMELI